MSGAPGDDHELLDLERGRKLERFGAATVVRPAPAAEGEAQLPRREWEEAHAEFVRDGRGGPGGAWHIRRPLPDPWTARSAGAEFLLEAAPSGQVGLYPEQAALRTRIAAIVRAAAEGGRTPRALDLFGYTGGTTMAMAGAGAEVTFVDASRGSVGWARRNFARNALAEAPIRSIAEDVARFVAREERRGNRYDVVTLDPPSFGRGPKGEVWKIERDLDALLAACRELLSPEPLLVLVTAHTESWTAVQLGARLDRALAGVPGRTTSGELLLTTAAGRSLRAGIFALRETA